MSPEEKFRVLVFLSLIAAVYVLAFSSLIRLLLDKVGLFKLPKSRVYLWIMRGSIIFAILGVLCFAYSYFIEPYWLSVRRVQIRSEKIAAGSEAIRIAHISDVHSDSIVRLEKRLPAAIAAEKPDLIVFSGDSINAASGLPVFRDCLKEIAKIAPTFVVKGNWDIGTPDLFAETGAIELNGNLETIEIKGNRFSLNGLAASNIGRLEDILASVPTQNFSLFLYHYPDAIERAAQNGVDLYCAGHTHGGQIALPFYGALVTLSKTGKKYEAGTFQVEKTWLNVNRGIGMEGGEAPRVRFWARPEITIIEVLPQ